ncbi:MAG: MSHA biogenesis protein MshP [Kangiellaceae bacterium]|jgi:MSHA biogenesis protein MshP
MYLNRTLISCNTPNKQSGSMIVMALFVIIVIGLLATAIINIVSASSNTTISQVYGLRAQQAAKAGIEDLMFTAFPVNGSAVSCNTTASSPASFSNVSGLNQCSYEATCDTQTISFNGVNRLYFKFSSTGSCQIDSNVVSRTLSVDALQQSTP